MTASELAELLEQTDDPDVAETLLDAYNRDHADPWDQWDEPHACNMLCTALADIDQESRRTGRTFTPREQAELLRIIDDLDRACDEQDMPLWRSSVHELRNRAVAMLNAKRGVRR
jgi:hypothetical protein